MGTTSYQTSEIGTNGPSLTTDELIYMNRQVTVPQEAGGYNQIEKDKVMSAFILLGLNVVLSIKYFGLSQRQQMSSKEIQAIENLANLPDEDDNFSFEPYTSTIYHQPKDNKPKHRPKTVDNKRNRSKSTNSSFRHTNKREQLKKHLKILEENNEEHAQTRNQRIITSQSLYFMQPKTNRYNGFPAQTIKKQQPDKFVNLKTLISKENYTPYYCLNPEEMIRNDIMKKFKLRESLRQSEKMTKINNFLKMAGTPSSRSKAAPILFLNETKFKRTLTNLLS